MRIGRRGLGLVVVVAAILVERVDAQAVAELVALAVCVAGNAAAEARRPTGP